MRYCPVPSLTTVLVFSMRTGLVTSTLTPGRTAADASLMTPASVACANARVGSSANSAPAVTIFTTRFIEPPSIVVSDRTFHRFVRQVLPLAVLLLVDTLEPHVEVSRLRIVRLRQIQIAAHRDRDVAVEFHLHMIKFAVEIRRRLRDDVGEPAGFRVDFERRAAGRPAVAVR